MHNEKLDPELTLSLTLPPAQRFKTDNLSVGYSSQTDTWELIIRYNGDIKRVADIVGFSVFTLYAGFAIIIIPEALIEELPNYPEIIYVEKPKALVLEDTAALRASCIRNTIIPGVKELNGSQTLIAIIDTGIDYTHPDFIDSEGQTRILYLWDQTIPGGIYNSAYINEALSITNPFERTAFLPSRDINGHGTAVAGIAAGNGRASGGEYSGVAPESELIIVKLGNPADTGSPMTAQLMSAVDFAVKTAVAAGRPIAINISYGTSYGAHDGSSLIEEYLTAVAGYWKTSICIGTGNEGASGRHAFGFLASPQGLAPAVPEIIQFTVADFTPYISLQLWKNYYDSFNIYLIAPDGGTEYEITRIGDVHRFIYGSTEINVLYTAPSPFSIREEIYFDFSVAGNDNFTEPSSVGRSFISPGVWTLRLIPVSIRDGRYMLWLPSGPAIQGSNRFLQPEADGSVTIPATARDVISVGAYNPVSDVPASFSGRGFSGSGYNRQIIPTITAPGVSITAPAPGGIYSQNTGTSFSTPFVTGAASLLMEWGIIKGNDPFLYGEKLKAFLIDGSRRPFGAAFEYPNTRTGWGTLCLTGSIPV